jgi:peptidoglycan/LPS O-acetylase OafA/YrhL
MSEPTTPTSEEPVGALVHRLSEQIPELVRSEMRLAQAELTEKGKKAGIGIGKFSAAGLLAYFGAAVLIVTAIVALDLVLPLWLACLIVAAALFLTAGLVALAGRKEIRQATPVAPTTTSSVKQDVAALKGKHL